MTKINVKWTIITSPSCHFFHNPGYSKTPQNMCVYVILYVYKRAQFTANPISVNARNTNIFFHPSSLHDLSSYCRMTCVPKNWYFVLLQVDIGTRKQICRLSAGWHVYHKNKLLTYCRVTYVHKKTYPLS